MCGLNVLLKILRVDHGHCKCHYLRYLFLSFKIYSPAALSFGIITEDCHPSKQ